MSGILKSLRWDLQSPIVRYTYLETLVRNVPGDFGVALRRAALRRFFRHAGNGLTIYPGARIIGVHVLSVGERCYIGYNNIIQATGGVEMGDDVVLGPSVKVWSVNHVFTRDDTHIMDQGYEFKPVVIGRGAWIGGDCFIMPGARIGEHAVVSAGSVVGAKDIEPYAIVAGNPARKIGSRRERPVAELATGSLRGDSMPR
jgi:maltose O-acetyltransferase